MGTESIFAITTGKFPLGQLTWTCGVNDRIADDEGFAKFVLQSIKRHAQGDWGDLSPEDVEENVLSLKEGFRLLSAYRYTDETKIWIITEADRSVTPALFPDEY
jgi:hypothetical protein